MKTILRKALAGSAITIFIGVMNSCSPVVYAPSKPRPVVHVVTPAPSPSPHYAEVVSAPSVQTVVVQPAIPVWAPPYTYVTEVHYYYFPDYMVYYDIFSRHYVYYNGYSWINVIVLPSLPIFMGFNPYNTYIVVLDRYTSNPWNRHSYYEQHYPKEYYKSAYAPRHSLNSNTVLRAYDENQRKPLFVDRKTNKEVRVDYTASQNPRTSTTNATVRNGSVSEPRVANTVGQTPRVETNSGTPVRNGESNPRLNTNTVKTPVNTRNQVSGNAAVSPVTQPVATESTGRKSVVSNQTSTVRTTNNGMPEKKVVSHAQKNIRTEPKAMPQVQQEGSSRNQIAPATSKPENKVQRNTQSVSIKPANAGNQKEQRAR